MQHSTRAPQRAKLDSVNRQSFAMNTTRHLAGNEDAAVPVPLLTKTPAAIAFDQAWTPIAHTFLGRIAIGTVDLLATLGVVLFVPIAILAIGIPFALCARLLLWLAGAL